MIELTSTQDREFHINDLYQKIEDQNISKYRKNVFTKLISQANNEYTFNFKFFPENNVWVCFLRYTISLDTKAGFDFYFECDSRDSDLCIVKLDDRGIEQFADLTMISTKSIRSLTRKITKVCPGMEKVYD